MSTPIFNRTPSSVFYVNLYFFLLYYSRNIQDRQSISTNPGRWQIGSNRKVNLLVSQLFWGWEEVQKGHFRFGLSFTKMQHGGNMDLLIE